MPKKPPGNYLIAARPLIRFGFYLNVRVCHQENGQDHTIYSRQTHQHGSASPRLPSKPLNALHMPFLHSPILKTSHQKGRITRIKNNEGLEDTYKEERNGTPLNFAVENLFVPLIY